MVIKLILIKCYIKKVLLFVMYLVNQSQVYIFKILILLVIINILIYIFLNIL